MNTNQTKLPSGLPLAPCSASPEIDLRTVLTVLAAEIFRAQNMPEIFASDWGFCKTTPLTDRVKCVVAGRAAHEQCRQWAIKLSEIAHSLPNVKVDLPPKRGGDGRLKYISSLKREDAVNVLKEWLINCGHEEEWMKHL